MGDGDIAQAIADGTPSPWGPPAGDPADRVTSSLLEAFMLLEAIAQFHAGRPGYPTSAAASITANGGTGSSPHTWGSLRILDEVGRGSCGTVYRAYDPHLDRVVALKVTANSSGGDAIGLEEGRALARVRHPNVVCVYGAEPRNETVGVWMEFVDGCTLEEELDSKGTMDSAELVKIGIALCAAVQAVHEAGLLHRDIKTQNIMRARSGRVLLMDLGAAGELDDIARTGLQGTPLYLAPEVLRGRPASRASDIYSIGVVLFRLATGTYPVYAQTLSELRELHGTRVERPLPPHIPPSLRTVISRALDPNPEQRFATASAVAHALSAAPAQSPRPDIHSNSVFLVSAAALLAAIGVVIAMERTQLRATRVRADAEQVTTYSDDARARYREATRLMSGAPPRMSAGAEGLLRDAIRYDPQFPSAFVLLAHALRNQGKPAREFLPYARTALQNSGRLPDAERHFIVGSWHDMNSFAAADFATAAREGRAALASYQTVLAIEPNHAWALTNALAIYRALGDNVEAAGLLARIADAHADDFRANAEAGSAMLESGRFESTLHYFDRAGQSPRPVPYNGFGFHLAVIRMLPGYRAWLERRIPAAVQHLDATAAMLANIPEDEQASTRQLLVWFAFTLGRLDQAETILANEPSGVVRRMLTTSLAGLRGDPTALRRALSDSTAALPGNRRVDLLLLAGLPREARAEQQLLEERRTTISDGLRWSPAAQNLRYNADLSRAEIALAESRPHEALSALAAMPSNGGLFDTRALAVRVSSLVALGRRSEAVDTLNAELSRARVSAITHAYDWIRNRAILRTLLRQDGQTDAARAVEAELRVLLAAADSDYPLALELEQIAER
jgi:serine/threonine-protein kinase